MKEDEELRGREREHQLLTLPNSLMIMRRDLSQLEQQQSEIHLKAPTANRGWGLDMKLLCCCYHRRLMLIYTLLSYQAAVRVCVSVCVCVCVSLNASPMASQCSQFHTVIG